MEKVEFISPFTKEDMAFNQEMVERSLGNSNSTYAETEFSNDYFAETSKIINDYLTKINAL